MSFYLKWNDMFHSCDNKKKKHKKDVIYVQIVPSSLCMDMGSNSTLFLMHDFCHFFFFMVFGWNFLSRMPSTNAKYLTLYGWVRSSPWKKLFFFIAPRSGILYFVDCTIFTNAKVKNIHRWIFTNARVSNIIGWP